MLEPLLSAPFVIQLHALSALVALGLGPFALYRRRRDRVHKSLGYAWVTAMSLTALSAFFIHSFPLIGPFSPIHALAVLALWSLWTGVRAAIRGDIRAHQQALQGLYWRGLIIAGLFNFLPGRTMNRVFFDDMRELGWLVIGLGGTLIVLDELRKRLARRTGSQAA